MPYQFIFLQMEHFARSRGVSGIVVSICSIQNKDIKFYEKLEYRLTSKRQIVAFPIIGGVVQEFVYELPLSLTQLYWSVYAGAQVVPQSDRLRLILNANNIAFEDVDLGQCEDKIQRRADMEARSGSDKLPQLFLHGKYIGEGRDAVAEIVYLNDSGQLKSNWQIYTESNPQTTSS